MSDTSGIQPPGIGPKGEIPPPPSEKNIPESQPDEGLTYLGFTFSDQKAYNTFKAKFLNNLINEMIRQIKKDNDQMIQSLKKFRDSENQ